MKAIRSNAKFRVGLVVAAVVSMAVAAMWAGPLVLAQAEGPQAAAGNADADAIRVIIAKYVKSIDDADTVLGSEIWSKSPEVSFVHPRGRERSWEGVKLNFYEKTMGAMFSERKLTTKDVAVHVHGDAAWAEFYWDFAAKLRDNGQLLKTEGRETQVFRKAEGRWELVHVHYSGMPMTGRGQGF